MKKAMLARIKSAGFTMIELLIVISILGILAVLVLSAINPLEQINRGRDTATRSDAEQMLGAIERYNAFQRMFPWRVAGGVLEMTTFPRITAAAPTDGTCPIIAKLAQGSVAPACTGSEELKASYVTRVTGYSAARSLYLYNGDSDSSAFNTYICFSPESNAFTLEARDRCFTSAGVLRTPPTDIDATTWGLICPSGASTNQAGEAKPMTCLP